MPIYVIECLHCGKEEEILTKMSQLDHELGNFKCKKCSGSDVKVKIAPFVNHFHYTRGQ